MTKAKNINDLAAEFKKLQKEHDEAKAKASEIYAQLEQIRKYDIPSKMEEMGTDSIRLKGIGTVGLRYDAYVSAQPGHQDQLKEWLSNEGHGDLIKDTVNSSTLKALVKEMFKNGQEIPDEIVKFEPYTYAVITNK